MKPPWIAPATPARMTRSRTGAGPCSRRPCLTPPWWPLLLVDELLLPGIHPRQRVTEPVAPVLPVVPVARLDEPHRHAGRLERGHHRAVGDDQRLVDPAADEEPVGDVRRPRAVAVDE